MPDIFVFNSVVDILRTITVTMGLFILGVNFGILNALWHRPRSVLDGASYARLRLPRAPVVMFFCGQQLFIIFVIAEIMDRVGDKALTWRTPLGLTVFTIKLATAINLYWHLRIREDPIIEVKAAEENHPEWMS